MKKRFFFISFLVAMALTCLAFIAGSRQYHKFTYDGVVPAAAAAEQKPTYPLMQEPGKKVSVGTDYYLIYGFDKKPKLGTVIMKVEVFTKEGKKETSFEAKADAGMPSMRAHDTGDRPFQLSKNGDYLLPINIVMPGGWEIRLTLLKDGKVIFRGSHQFDV
jgi:hypothetical protein